MANTEEQTTEVKNVVHNFRVPKRELHIDGMYKRRPFNDRYNRPIKKNEIFTQLVNDELISEVYLGAKNCFFVKELSEDNKKALETTLDVENRFDQAKYSGYEFEEKGWWTIFTSSKDGNKPCAEVMDGIEAYHKIEDPENKNCLTMYGDIGFSVDFSKLNMVSDDTGIVFPYGILFFSDSKSFINQFSATCAVLPRRLELANHNAYINQITDWTKASIRGSFRSSGHFVIFYVSEVEEVKEGDETYSYPKVSIIDIEVLLNRDRDGTISTIGIGRVEKSTTLAKDLAKDAYGSEINFLIKNVFSKRAVASIASSHFISDYIYLVGDNPRYYDLSYFRSSVDGQKKSENFSKDKKETKDEKKQEVTDNKSDSSKQNKPTKKKKAAPKAKKEETKEVEKTVVEDSVAIEEAITETPAEEVSTEKSEE